MDELGITLESVGPGWCHTSLSVEPRLLQQHGYVHGGVIATLADHTAGRAAKAAVARGFDIVTIEFKMNFLRPVLGRTLTCRGQTLRAGRNVVVAESEVFSGEEGGRHLVAKCTATLAIIPQANGSGNALA